MQPSSSMPAPVENKQSRLLHYEENQQIFKLLGANCQSMATCVVQLYKTQAPTHSEWVHKDAGVLCFVKDNLRKNYFLRFYCVNRNKMIWEQELYIHMDYLVTLPYLHTFEADDCMVCFNFASEEEAKELKDLVAQKLMLKRRREAKRNKSQSNTSTHGSHRHNNTEPLSISSVNSANRKTKRRRNLTKADIGQPEGFRHVSHVGFNPDTGFAVDTEDLALTDLLKKAGISEKQLQKHRDFIYGFLRDRNQEHMINESKARRPPPAPPSQVSTTPASPASTGLAGPPVPPRGGPPRTPHNRVAPPPPPSVTQASTHASTPPPRPANAPTPKAVPPPPVNNAPAPPPPPIPSAAACPPPPPMAPSLVADAAQVDGRSALLESIRNGASLRPVVPDADKRVEDARGDLLSEIRKGFQLKPATEREVKPISPSAESQHNGVNDLAAALSRALAERSRAIHPDDDSESSDSNEDWDD